MALPKNSQKEKMNTTQKVNFVRVIRTPSSERYLVQMVDLPGEDLAAIDIHYLAEEIVAATLTLLDSKYSDPKMLESLMTTIDTHLLPMASLKDGDLYFTVVKGVLIGEFRSVSGPERP